MNRRLATAALAMAALAAIAAPALAQDTIKIGELNSYKSQPAFLEPYKMGMALALEEINGKGGVLGKKLELVSRDDGGNPRQAVRVAEDLVTREGVVMLTGTYLSEVGLAIADFASQKKIFFLAAGPLTDKITWANGNKYTFRLRPSTTMQTAMLMPAAKSANAKKWALVYPSSEYGLAAASAFKEMMKKAQPEVEFVTEQPVPLGKFDAGAVTQAIGDTKPDAIFNALAGADLAKFVREGNTRGLFKDRTVVSLLSGEPEFLDFLANEAPAGWIVTGFPWNKIKTAEYLAFLTAYQKKFNDYPRLGSVLGYMTIKSLATGIAKAKSTDSEKLVQTFKGLYVSSPFGPFYFRASDHQATMGAYVGKIALENGKGTMVDFKYIDGASVLPDDAAVKKLRPAAD